MARTCVFCGGAPVTSEHVLPKWLAAGFPEDVLTDPATIVRYREGSDQRHRGRMLTTEVKVVCGPCNNGWMSKLENKVKPTLLPLVKGEITKITPPEQEALAAWILKTALMFQFVHSAELHVLPDWHYTEFYREQRPTELMRVSTAYMVPPEYLNGVSPVEHSSIPSETRFTTPDGLNHRLWSIVVTMRIGYAVLQIISVGPKGYQFELDFTGFTPYLAPIWPPSSDAVSWPPRALRSIDDFNAFADPLKNKKVIL